MTMSAFDVLALDRGDLRKLPLHLRKTNLARLMARRPEGIFVSDFELGQIGPTYSAISAVAPTRFCGTMSVSGLGLGCQMAIYRLLRNSPLKPEEISRLEAAYEQALRTLCVKERDDPLTEMIAKKIIKIAKTGIHDPTQIAARVIKELGIP
jgi:hypothetical protein